MSVPLRQYRLSPYKGEGIHCDAAGAFVGGVPLLQWSSGTWWARDNVELSERLSEVYGLPVDFAGKSEGVSAIARALNKGDIARAQMIALHLQLPEPLPLAKNAPSQNDVDMLTGLLECAGVLKINYRHYPAGSPDRKGGRFAPKNGDGSQPSGAKQQDQTDLTDDLGPIDDPTREVSEPAAAESDLSGEQATRAGSGAIADAERRAAIRAAVRDAALSIERADLRLAARRAFREAAVKALEKMGAKLALNEIPIVGVVADLATVYDVYRFVREFSELRAAIKAATRFVNEGPHTLAQLRVSSESLTFPNYEAFLKVWDPAMAEIDFEKRFRAAGAGSAYHHIIEQSSGEALSITESTDNIVKIPAILHEEINARYAQNQARFGGRSLREWLKTQPRAVRREWGIRMMREVGIIVGE